MRDNLVYTKYYLIYRDKKGKVGYQLDFMVLKQDDEEIPFINIYLFLNNTNAHRHFIINPNGILKTAHYKYKSNWQEKDKSVPKIELYYPPKYYKIIWNFFKNYYILEYLKSTKRIFYNVYIEPVYLNLMQKAVDNFFQSKGNSIWDLFIIINSKNELIPLSEKSNKVKKIQNNKKN